MLKRIFFFVSLTLISTMATGRTWYPTKLYLDSKPIQVYFNDGDTFHYLSNGARISARLTGYNTLESFGPIHQWGQWTPEELFGIAKAATQEARKGSWYCHSGSHSDTYGRQLVSCPDLAKHLIDRGLAHVMLINSTERSPLLSFQAQAIQNQLGFWKKGVPAYVLSSVHSADESHRRAYDRLVSTQTGRSFLIVHNRTYSPCQKVQHTLSASEYSSSMVYLLSNQRYRASNPC
ncbi:MAG: nuclease [Myxococcaceae bacterium]|nr:nuclease [Myxococcaceae bacterium]MBH2006294.1 nuclease [Myxococcaceae bacterium]